MSIYSKTIEILVCIFQMMLSISVTQYISEDIKYFCLHFRGNLVFLSIFQRILSIFVYISENIELFLCIFQRT